jgi:small nuclear ribonucleoprotein
MKPLEVLQQNLHKSVLVEIRGGHSFRGVLDAFDQHLNLVLSNAEETTKGADRPTSRPGVTLVRGDSVIFISP